MSRYPSTSQFSPSGVAEPAIQEAGKADMARHDRDGSLSDSESSAAFKDYAEHADNEGSSPEDPYHALTSQTLNADGTPKRPMNAFMIFARKRRPQISAANQMMRTGDVSKILSKEWNSMEMSEKKFYLDQAKKLKDNFNSKYPDYVYRRRPNNSRKKRKAEPSHDDHSDPNHMGDPDDPAYEDTSPVDADDPLMIPSPQEVQYTRSHALNPTSPMYHSHEGVPPSTAPACTYPYSSDFHPPHPGQPSRLPHLADSHSLPAGNIGPVRATSMNDVGTLTQGYQSQSLYQTSSHSSSLYPTHGSAHPSHGLWDNSRGPPRTDPARSSNWPVLPALDINLARQRSSMSTMTSALSSSTNGKTDTAYSPSLPTRPWSSATSSTASSSSSASTSQPYGPSGPGTANAFPTLNSAFYPNESPATKAMDLGGSPPAAAATTPAGSHDYFSSPALPGPGSVAASGRRPSAGADQGGYGQYGSSAPNAVAGGWGSQQQSQYGRSGAGSQRPGVPGLHSHSHALSHYSLQGSPGEGGSARSAAAAATASASGAHMGYWDDRFGGR
ncbi:transcription factor [Ganoderma sinense ZZ0214-1]|uniref:Transcription factor n=1 Tax=Ganoderma sinense ZZ0214-1 TaxID=1077348 RepID=A0A2G8S8Z2_9APHY|nr:transcription factor [Ganoderma sinense ZZ0214-1]